MNSTTVWPAVSIAQLVKNVMSLLLNLLDYKGDDAGDRLADEVFTSNGHFGAAHSSAKGSAGSKPLAGIELCRSHDRNHWRRDQEIPSHRLGQSRFPKARNSPSFRGQ
jgi:hypothetical protein